MTNLPNLDPVIRMGDRRHQPDLDLPPLRVAAFNGRAPEIVQGFHPNPDTPMSNRGGGANAWGYVLFDLAAARAQIPMPSRAQILLHARHWYYAEGGSAILSIVSADGKRLSEPLVCEGWPRNCTKAVELPEHWLLHLSVLGRGAGIAIGLEEWEDKDLRCYGRFDGRRSRLRVWR